MTSISIDRITIRPTSRKGSKRVKWVADIPADLAGGKRSRKFFDSVNEAKKFAKLYLRQLYNGALNKPEEPMEQVLFKNLTLDWLEHQNHRVKTEKKKLSSLKTDKHRLKGILPFLGNVPISDITTEILEKFQELRRDIGLKPVTVNSDVRVIRKIINWGRKKQYQCMMPEIEKLREEKVNQHIPSQDEMTKVIANVCPKSRTIIKFLLETGCRAGEAYNLTWDDIDTANKVVEINAKDGWTPKTEHSKRNFPISSSLCKEIMKLPKKDRYVFSSRVPGQPLTSVRKALCTGVTKAGLMHKDKPLHLTLHALRKINATWRANAGVPERVLQQLLGHAAGTAVTNKHYVMATNGAMLDAVIEL